MLVEHGAINSTDNLGYKPMDLAHKQNNEKKHFVCWNDVESGLEEYVLYYNKQYTGQSVQKNGPRHNLNVHKTLRRRSRRLMYVRFRSFVQGVIIVSKIS